MDVLCRPFDGVACWGVGGGIGNDFIAHAIQICHKTRFGGVFCFIGLGLTFNHVARLAGGSGFGGVVLSFGGNVVYVSRIYLQ